MQRPSPVLLFVWGLAILVSRTQPAEAHSLEALENQLLDRERYVEIVERPAPDYLLVDADGENRRLSDLRGKVVVMWFVNPDCPDVCPLQSDLLASVQGDVNQTPMRDLVEFATISTNPATDSPEKMREYGMQHGLDPANWTMVTAGDGINETAMKVAADYGLKFTEQENGYQVHGVVTHLIDKSGNLRARYHGLKFNPTNLLVHINALTNDSH